MMRARTIALLLLMLVGSAAAHDVALTVARALLPNVAWMLP